MNDQPSCRSEFSSQSAPSAITADPNRPAGYPASRAERRPWPGTPARAPADPNLSNAMPHNVRPACTLCRPSLADRHPATTNARPRPIPRACRRREPPSRNAIQRETGERPVPTDPAHPHAAPTEARAEPIARQPRTRICRTHCHTTWYGGAPDRALGLAFTPTDRGSRRTAHLHPHPPRPQMLRTTTTPPPVADDTGNRTLYLTHPPANAPHGTLTTDHW